MKEKNSTIVSRYAPRRKGETEFARLDAMTDKEIEQSVRNDPDAVPLDLDWSKGALIPGRKSPKPKKRA
jgi:hypothetical protein